MKKEIVISTTILVAGIAIYIGSTKRKESKPLPAQPAQEHEGDDSIVIAGPETFATALDSPFNPNFYKSVPGALLVTRETAQKLATMLYDAFSFWNDDEDAVYGVFRNLKAKTQVSWIADVFFQLFNADLYQYLRSRMSDEEMDIVHGIVMNLQSPISKTLTGISRS